jgi:hypothetical protein
VALTMKQRIAVTRELHKRYTKATKKEKQTILNEFTHLTGYNRSYAARTLRREPRDGRLRKARRVRSRIYTDEVLVVLRKVWYVADMICGKRLKPFLPELAGRLEYFNELTLSPECKERLFSMSPATIDRLLAKERKKLSLKGRTTTKPGTLLKHQIPIRTFADWDDARPGFLEIDLVAHDGGSSSGDFIHTLDATDVSTGWTETRAVRNKAQVWVFSALKDIIRRLPFPVLGIDSDNGSEFINNQLKRFCEAEKITFTRSRANKKNDNCFVEQKNWSVVRRAVGYLRYDTGEELALLNELYGYLRLYTNFFSPSMKLIEKNRDGAKITKRYDTAKTPYLRSRERDDVSDEAKESLCACYVRLNPAELKRRITQLQNTLIKLATGRMGTQRQTDCKNNDFEYIFDEATNEAFEYISK